MRLPIRIGLLLTGILLASPGLAGPAAAPFAAPQFAHADAVGTDTLDSCRGGFVGPSGLVVTLGIERIVTINGNVLERSELQLGELGRLTAGAPLPAQAARQLSLIQDGSLAVQFGPSLLGGTLIQNRLNNQLIQNATIINAGVDARGALQAMHFQSTLANALNLALTGR